VKPLNDALLRLMAYLHGLVSEGARERGQTLSEYSLILTIVAVGVTVAAVIAFRGAIMQAFAAATDQFPP
jgi:Flp pilus assembly pilin Flp